MRFTKNQMEQYVAEGIRRRLSKHRFWRLLFLIVAVSAAFTVGVYNSEVSKTNIEKFLNWSKAQAVSFLQSIK